jgi:hypothetical protein
MNVTINEGGKDVLKRELMDTCPPIIARGEVGKITGGLLTPRTLANLDSLGRGPKGKVAMGKIRVGYLREPFVDWFCERLTVQG